MRWLIFFLLVCAALWYIKGIEEVPPPPLEEGFIGGPVKALHKAENFEKSYLEANQAQKKKMEEQIEKGSGG
jgi:hypothetical protein